MAQAVVAVGGGTVLGVVFFGSRKTRAHPGAGSAYDLFVVVGDYREFYGALAAAGRLRRPPGLLAALNSVLSPNQVSFHFRLADATPGRAKCAVISLAQLCHETSPERHDHFCLGRLFQPVEVLYTKNYAAREQILAALVSAHTLTYEWVRPWLPARFDVAEYARTLLRTSFSGEIRPEPAAARTEALFEAQAAYLEPVYGQLLRELCERGELIEMEPGVFRLAHPAGLGERIRCTLYFKRSLVRATLRWGKHIVTFDGWLDFIVSKAQRHTGQEIVLTPRERRFPVLFLWPRVWRYLRHKNG